MEKLYKAIDEVVSCVKDCNEYKMCLSLKERMSQNEEIVTLIEQIKKLQKEYIKKEYDETIKKELDEVNKRLSEISIYNIYLDNLEKVNYKIEYIKDELNDYFYRLLNSDV